MVTPVVQRIFLTAVFGMSFVAAGTLGPSNVTAQTYGQQVPASGPEAPIGIAQYMFHPNALRIAVGTTVAWTNYDGFAHTSSSDTGIWNSGPISPGSSYRYTFNTPGTYPYHCMIHPFMHGVIIVQAATGLLAASPNPVLNGGTTVIFGQNFSPHSWVFVNWRRPDGTMTGFWIFTRWDGSFAFRLFANPRHGCGPRTFVVFDSATGTWSPQFVLNEIC